MQHDTHREENNNHRNVLQQVDWWIKLYEMERIVPKGAQKRRYCLPTERRKPNY